MIRYVCNLSPLQIALTSEFCEPSKWDHNRIYSRTVIFVVVCQWWGNNFKKRVYSQQRMVKSTLHEVAWVMQLMKRLHHGIQNVYPNTSSSSSKNMADILYTLHELKIWHLTSAFSKNHGNSDFILLHFHVSEFRPYNPRQTSDLLNCKYLYPIGNCLP